MPDYSQVASEFLKALRGRRSQVGASRRLGYASNVFAQWESGRRLPLAIHMLAACERFGVEAAPAFEKFGPIAASSVMPTGGASLARWLRALMADRTIVQVAAASSRSRHQVSRFVSGKTQPRLHDLFALVDACTGRLPDFVSRFVPISTVPSLAAEYERIASSRSLSFEQPWVSAILAALDAMPKLVSVQAAKVLAAGLTLPETQVKVCLAALERAGVVEWHENGVRLAGPLLVDTGANPDGARQLRHHWSQVATQRSAAPRANDLFSYNVFSVSRDDLQQLRRLQTEYYQRVRELIVDSEPETVALLNLQLMEWDVREG